MNSKFYSLLFSLVFIILTGSSVQIFACSCLDRQTVCEAYGTSKAVFIGEVVEGSNPDGISDVPPSERTLNYFVLKVKRNFAGAEEGKTVAIQTGYGDCAVTFRKGKNYLVFASENGSSLYTTVCSPTRRLAEGEENPPEIASLFSAKGAQIYGSADFWAKLYASKDANQPLAKLDLLIEQTDGAQNKFTLTTDDQGKYKIADLPAGNYKIAPSIPFGLKITSRYTREFTLNEKGCAKKDLYFYNDSLLKGRVIDGYEKSVVKLPIDLVPADLMPPDFNFRPPLGESLAGKSFTSANGEFAYKSVPPGRYFLVANFNYLPDAKNPYPTTFYKSADEKSAATIIEIGRGQKIENLLIQLPPPLPTNEIRGKVFWQNGKPARNVFVYIRDIKNNQFISNSRTDNEGNFILQGFTGRKYAISAHAGSSGGIMVFEFKVPDIEFTFGAETGSFKLILEKNPEFK